MSFLIHLKNNIAALTAIAAFACMPGLALAQQDIEVQSLGAAIPVDPGILNPSNGGLDSGLWQGTDAALAQDLIEAAPEYSHLRSVNILVQRALLSEGEPPAGGLNNGDYSATRIRKIWDAGYGDAARLNFETLWHAHRPGHYAAAIRYRAG